MEKLTELALTQTREALVRGRVSARELTQAWLAAMEAEGRGHRRLYHPLPRPRPGGGGGCR